MRKLFPKKSTKISMSVFPRFFFYRVFGCFSAMGVQNTTNTFCKKIVSKSLYKKFDQKSKTDFFSIFFDHVFGGFSVRGVQKHDKKIREKINLTPSLFLTPTHPPTTGVTDFFFLPAPWGERHPLGGEAAPLARCSPPTALITNYKCTSACVLCRPVPRLVNNANAASCARSIFMSCTYNTSCVRILMLFNIFLHPSPFFGGAFTIMQAAQRVPPKKREPGPRVGGLRAHTASTHPQLVQPQHPGALVL
jgi:hypothetical protein